MSEGDDHLEFSVEKEKTTNFWVDFVFTVMIMQYSAF